MIQDKKLLGVTFLFEVNWLRCVGVIDIFLFLKGGGVYPPFWNFENVFWFRIKSYGGPLFVWSQLVELFRSYWHFLSFSRGRCFLTPHFKILKMFFDSEEKVMGGHLFVSSQLFEWFRIHRYFLFLKGGAFFYPLLKF